MVIAAEIAAQVALAIGDVEFEHVAPLPFCLDRIDNRYLWEHEMAGSSPKLKRRPSDYIRENIIITTSGMNFAPPLQLAVSVLERPGQREPSTMRTRTTQAVDVRHDPAIAVGQRVVLSGLDACGRRGPGPARARGRAERATLRTGRCPVTDTPTASRRWNKAGK